MHDLSRPPSSAECQTVRGRAPLSYPSTTRPLSPPCEAALMLTMMTLIDDLGQQTGALKSCPVMMYRPERASVIGFGIGCIQDMHRRAMQRAAWAAVIVATRPPRTAVGVLVR